MHRRHRGASEWQLRGAWSQSQPHFVQPPRANKSRKRQVAARKVLAMGNLSWSRRVPRALAERTRLSSKWWMFRTP